jgi:hypothetical protein
MLRLIVLFGRTRLSIILIVLWLLTTSYPLDSSCWELHESLMMTHKLLFVQAIYFLSLDEGQTLKVLIILIKLCYSPLSWIWLWEVTTEPDFVYQVILLTLRSRTWWGLAIFFLFFCYCYYYSFFPFLFFIFYFLFFFLLLFLLFLFLFIYLFIYHCYLYSCCCDICKYAYSPFDPWGYFCHSVDFVSLLIFYFRFFSWLKPCLDCLMITLNANWN